MTGVYHTISVRDKRIKRTSSHEARKLNDLQKISACPRMAPSSIVLLKSKERSLDDSSDVCTLAQCHVGTGDAVHPGAIFLCVLF